MQSVFYSSLSTGFSGSLKEPQHGYLERASAVLSRHGFKETTAFARPATPKLNLLKMKKHHQEHIE